MSTERTALLPLSKITIGYNPRRFFDPAKHADLVASIQRQGVLQSLLVRPGETEDSYVLVCGGRRYRAALEALGPDAEIPVVIREMTDQEALDAAASENEDRDNTSETEQADAALRMLAACAGDKAETAKRLGWSPSKLARRLALGELADPVKLALDERRIKVGHAELLAAVPTDKQAKALETILAAGLDVAKTRDLLMKVTQDLAHACFDKSECTTCPFNSGTQRALFETHVDDGHCTNAACFTLKTEAAEQARAAEDATAAAAIAASAPATAATLDDGNDINAENLAADIADSPEGEAVTPAPAASANTNSPGIDTSTAVVAATPAAPSAAKTVTAGPVVTARTLAGRAKALREATWRTALARHLAQDTSNAWQVLLVAAYSGTISQIKRETLPARAALLIGEGFREAAIAGQIAMVRKLASTEAATALSAIGAAFAKDVETFSTVAALAEAYGVDIRGLWRVDQAFLDLYTKDELKFIAHECGLVEHMGTKPFGKLLASKKADLVAGMLNATGFTWEGRLPSAMTLGGEYSPPPAHSNAEPSTPAADETTKASGTTGDPAAADTGDTSSSEGDIAGTSVEADREPAGIASDEPPALLGADPESDDDDDGFGTDFFGETPLPHEEAAAA